MAERKKEKQQPEVKPLNIMPWIPVMAILGFIIGFAVCYLTFVHYGGN